MIGPTKTHPSLYPAKQVLILGDALCKAIMEIENGEAKTIRFGVASESGPPIIVSCRKLSRRLFDARHMSRATERPI